MSDGRGSRDDLDDIEGQIEAEMGQHEQSSDQQREAMMMQADAGQQSEQQIDLFDSNNELTAEADDVVSGGGKAQLGRSSSGRLDGKNDDSRGTSDPQSKRQDSAGELPKSSFYLSVHKAGLEGVDKEKVHQVITGASKGSKYYDQEE